MTRTFERRKPIGGPEKSSFLERQKGLWVKIQDQGSGFRVLSAYADWEDRLWTQLYQLTALAFTAG